MSNKLILLLFFLGGCTSIPKMEGDARVASLSFAQVEKEAEESGVFITGNFPGLEWWKEFKDVQLTALIEEALKGNPTLKKTHARITYAQEMAKVKRSFLIPTLGVEAESNWMYFGKNSFFRSLDPDLPPYIDQIDVGPTFTYEFDFWGKNFHALKAALGLKRVEMAEAASALLMITTGMTEAYFTAQRDLAREAVLQEVKTLRESFWKLTGARKIQGVGTQMEMLKAKKRVEDALEALAQTHKILATDHYILDGLIGQSPGLCKVTYTSLEADSPLELPPHIALDLVARRPDLTAQIWRAEVVAHEVGAAKADFYPNVDLNVFAGLESLHFGTLFSPQSYLYSILPAIHLPIFNAGRIRSNLKSKLAKFEEAIFAYNETLLKAAQEVADGIATTHWICKQIAIQQEVLTLLGNQVELAVARFEKGLDTALEVIEVQERLCAEKIKMIDLKYRKIVAKIHLIKALGGGFNG